MKLLTEEMLMDFAEKVKKNALYNLEGTPRVGFVASERRDAIVIIGDKKFALTLNSVDNLLVAGYGPVEEAEFVEHGSWILTQKGKTYRQNILNEWAAKQK